VREYRCRGAGTGAGIWSVLAGGFTTMVVILALLLAGAAIAGTSTLLLLTCAVAVMAAGAVGLTAAPRLTLAVSRRLSRRPRRSPTIARLADAVAGLPRQPTGAGWAAGVLACAAAGLAADAGVLTACFGLAGLPVPWRGLLFAYAVGQAAGRLVPLPGGLGGMEGGMLGALALTGTPPAAAAAAVIVYRAAGFWALGAAGTTVAAALTRRRRGGPEPVSTTTRAAPLTAPTPAGNEDARPVLGSRRHGSARSCRQRFHPQAHLPPGKTTDAGRPAKPTATTPACSKNAGATQCRYYVQRKKANLFLVPSPPASPDGGRWASTTRLPIVAIRSARCSGPRAVSMRRSAPTSRRWRSPRRLAGRLCLRLGSSSSAWGRWPATSSASSARPTAPRPSPGPASSA